MEDITFRLEGIIKNREVTEDFEGPLSLILMLLSKNKIEIRDIQISLILEQYLASIDEMREKDLELASEFIEMAARLLYIKTCSLLTGDEEVSELESLMSSLEKLRCKDLHLAVKETSPYFLERSERGARIYTKPPEPPKQNASYAARHAPMELLAALSVMLTRQVGVCEPETAVPRIVPKRVSYGVREKSRQIIELLRAGGLARLSKLFLMSKSRSELVATFVSVLELCAMGSLRLSGEGGDLQVCYTGGDPEDSLEALTIY